MTLFDETNAPYSDSNTTTLTEQQPTSPESPQSEHPAHGQEESGHVEANPPELGHDEKQAVAGADDFASALESFTTEAEEAISEDHVLKGTVLKLTPTHVVVDIGAKSEGMLPMAEVLDHEVKPQFHPSDEMKIIRGKATTEWGECNGAI